MRISVNTIALDNTFRIAFVIAELEDNVAYWIWFDGSFWQCNKMLSMGSEGIFLFHIKEDHACHMARQSSGHQFKEKKQQMGYKYL